MVDEEPHDEKAATGNPQAGNNTEPRREYLRRTILAGTAAGLAHFMVLGGRVRRVFAEGDSCSDYVNDNCTSTDPDLCDPDGTTGDLCERGIGAGGDSDDCNPPHYNGPAGDICCAADDQMGDIPDR